MSGELLYAILYLYVGIGTIVFVVTGLATVKNIKTLLGVAFLWPLTLPILLVKLAICVVAEVWYWRW